MNMYSFLTIKLTVLKKIKRTKQGMAIKWKMYAWTDKNIEYKKLKAIKYVVPRTIILDVMTVSKCILITIS